MSELRTIDYIREKERAVFSSIPGMNELLQAKPNEVPDIEVQYPDAVFALQTANSLFNHNRDLSVITQRAYFSILNGENISDVRFRYDREMTEYWKRHMWDD